MKHGWEYRKIAEVTSLVADGDWIESKDQSETGIRLIQTGNIGVGVFKAKDDKPHYISEETFARLGCTEIFEGDCLVSRLPDPIGRACIIPSSINRMITAVDCTIIRFANTIYPPFFVYYSRSKQYKSSIDNQTTGSTRKRISRKNLEKVVIPVPSIEEQKKICSLLDKMNRVIEAKKEQFKELDNLAQAIFYDMFGDPMTNEKGWEAKRLEEISTIGTGATPNRDVDSYYVNGDIPWVKTTEVHNNKIFETEEKITSKALAETSCSLYKKGTILLAMYGQGKTRGQVARLYIDAAINQACAAIIINHNCNPDYAYYYLLYNYKSIRGLARGGNQANLNLGIVKSIKMMIPPLPLQQAFSEKVEAIERQKELINQSVREVQTLFDSRMDYWFSEEDDDFGQLDKLD